MKMKKQWNKGHDFGVDEIDLRIVEVIHWHKTMVKYMLQGGSNSDLRIVDAISWQGRVGQTKEGAPLPLAAPPPDSST